MNLDWLEFEFSVASTSELSILSDSREIDDSGEKSKHVTPLLVGFDRKPYIPASTLKGALRARCGGTNIQNIFGYANIGEQDDKSQMGALALDDATWLSDEAFEKKSKNARTRTSIDRDRGSAADHKLFSSSSLKAGTTFKISGKFYFNASVDEQETAIDNLSQVISAMEEGSGGLPIGGGTRFTNGGLVRSTKVKCHAHVFDGTIGDWKEPIDVGQAVLEKAQSIESSSPIESVLSFTLDSDSPFIITDPDRERANDSIPQIQAMVDDNGNPVIPGTSLIGVLRSRAAWLKELELLNAVDTIPSENKAPADDLFLEHKLDGAVRKPTRDELSQLTSIERLFGVSGFKGLLEITKLERNENSLASMELVNVAIDRFTGGALDTALFKTEAYLNQSWKVTLGINLQRVTELYELLTEAKKEDAETLKKLLDDLKDNGIEIGHAASRGLGWFNVEDGETFQILKGNSDA